MVVNTDTHCLEPVAFKASPDIGGEITPTLLLIHFTAGGHASGSIEWLTRQDDSFLSAHLVVSRAGEITQLVPFNRRASHAGVSEWKGQKWCNNFSIGIEIANWGLLKGKADALNFLAWNGKSLVPSSQVVEATHKYGKPSGYWETFPKAQYEAVVIVSRMLFEAYPSLVDIAGHDDVAPGRKIDPGPAWPMDQFKQDVLFMGRVPESSSSTDLDVRVDAPLSEVERTVSEALHNKYGGV